MQLLLPTITQLSAFWYCLCKWYGFSPINFYLKNFPNKQKKPRLFSRDYNLSAISFRLPSDSIPTVASSDSPLSSTFVSDFSRLSAPQIPLFRFLFLSSNFLFSFVHFFFGFWLLSLCFYLSLIFLSPPHSGFFSAHLLLSFPMCSPLPFAWFLMHSFTVLVLRLTVCFFSPFPDSLPQLFLRCLLPDFSFRIFHFPLVFFRPLQFNFRLLSFLFLPFCSSRFYLTAVFTMHPFHFRFQDFPVTFCLISHASLHGSLTWHYWWFPFALPWFTPAAVPQVIPFWISSLGPMHNFRFLSSTSALASHYLASVSSVLFFLVLSYSDFSSASSFPFGPDVFRLIIWLVSHSSFQASDTWLSVCFLSLYSDSLPQLFLRWFPYAFAFGTFCFQFTFFRSCSVRFMLFSFLCFPFHSS